MSKALILAFIMYLNSTSLEWSFTCFGFHTALPCEQSSPVKLHCLKTSLFKNLDCSSIKKLHLSRLFTSQNLSQWSIFTSEASLVRKIYPPLLAFSLLVKILHQWSFTSEEMNIACFLFVCLTMLWCVCVLVLYAAVWNVQMFGCMFVCLVFVVLLVCAWVGRLGVCVGCLGLHVCPWMLFVVQQGQTGSKNKQKTQKATAVCKDPNWGFDGKWISRKPFRKELFRRRLRPLDQNWRFSSDVLFPWIYASVAPSHH